ncbi:MAG TPA: hypothetical protein VGA09_05700, partial [Candidatus Binatia bacterium]
MMKKTAMIIAGAFLTVSLCGTIGATAEKSGKEPVQKPMKERVQQSATTASAATAAARAFEKLSNELYPKAKQEGNLIIYSVWDVEHLRAITEAFMKRYPG